jgi:hypothetical protein
MASTNFGQSVLKLTQSGDTLQLADWFTPYNELYLDENDRDLSEPVLVLPTQPGKHPNLVATVGKEGTIYLLNQDNMGHFCATCLKKDSNIVQELVGVAPWTGALVYWNNTIYSSGGGMPIAAIALSNGRMATTPFAQSKAEGGGHSPVISANGTTNGILWQITGQYLLALDAVTLEKVYGGGQAPDGRDLLPPLPHFANVVVANGKVYIGSKNSLVAFGLLP